MVDAVGAVAQVRTATHHPSAALLRPGRVTRLGGQVVVGAEPVRAPLPDVAGDVV